MGCRTENKTFGDFNLFACTYNYRSSNVHTFQIYIKRKGGDK